MLRQKANLFHNGCIVDQVPGFNNQPFFIEKVQIPKGSGELFVCGRFNGAGTEQVIKWIEDL